MGAPPRRILLTGGGTAGHVHPALAIGRALAGPESSLLFVGVRGRAEATIVPRERIPIRFVRASGFPGSRPSLALARFGVDMVVGTLQALVILLSFRPDTIIGTGGFASAPVIFAASLLRRVRVSHARLYLHEQNVVPGRLNVLIGRVAERVFLTFPESLPYFPQNGLVVGYPLRKAASTRADEGSALDFTIPDGRQVVLAFGGSQGARAINRAVVDALGSLLPHRDRVFVVHGTGLRKNGEYDAEADTRRRLEERYGPAERAAIATFYVARPYFHAIEQVYARAALVVGRAGAGTLNELAARGLPAIIVPKMNLPGEHQVRNARAMARCGGAVVLYEQTVSEDGAVFERLSGEDLARTVLRLLDDPEELRRMGARTAACVQTDAVATIRSVVVDNVGLPEAVEPWAGETDAVAHLGNEALLRRLEAAAARAGAAWSAAREIPSEDDRAYFVSRAASLLVEPAWESRNLGVKLLGLLQARSKVPLIVALLEDRTPASRLERIVGGDFRQVGFIRRNALAALARLGVVDAAVERVLEMSFSDPYFEARAEAARASASLERSLSGEGRAAITAGLVRLLGDRWIEVAAAAAAALGSVGRGPETLQVLFGLADARFWLVRAAALEGLRVFVERGASGVDLHALEPALRRFVLTSTDFRPQFAIKAAYARLLDAIDRQARRIES